ncbi:MAG TPA: enoyl-CoA hydratase-related protein [Pseudonocardia sp.]|jgi:2-(1,2-epoxy-1,2-dihydrophenyl)acetyl-CoA isomerase|uniref:enoyl-CoA hydratase/isomerase family protein n=1 Tax=Pseudonocardia sp. TaxID=60912 RepID=UPI002F42CEEB
MTRKLIDSGMVLLDIADNGVGHLTLNRPEAFNGMSVPFLRALYDALMRCHSEPELRALVLRGAGAHFCAGGDIKDFASKGEALPDYLRVATSWLQISVTALMRLNAPVVAAVHGYAAGGGGFGLVCAADLVVAGESAKFLPGATRAGMAPDAGVSVTLPRLIGLRRAMELVLTNPTLSAARAKELGLVNRVVPDEALSEAADQLAGTLAEGAPLALAQSKRLLWDGVGRSVETGLPDEARTVAELSGTADAREGLAAVIERRRPRFTGR